MILFATWLIILISGALLSLFRALIGPGPCSRMVAVDVITTITAGMMIIISVIMKNGLLLDVSLVYSILSFVSVMVLARYMEKGV